MFYVDSRSLFLAGVRVLHFFQFGKVVGKVPTAAMPEEKRDFITFVRNDGQGEEEERFLSAQADAFAGANAEEKVGLLRSK